MNAGTGERLSAMPQPDSASAPPVIKTMETMSRRIRRWYPPPVKITRNQGQFAGVSHQHLLKARSGVCDHPAAG
jgi:hypothetical protein